MPGFYRNRPPKEANIRAGRTLLNIHEFVLASRVLEVYGSGGLGRTFARGEVQLRENDGIIVPVAGIDK
jgi:hypothetical protein